MKSPEFINLPIAGFEYNQGDEQLFRRAVEQAYFDLRNDTRQGLQQKEASSSLSLRRHQFLLMGASNG
jgi:hypothetical protein